MWAPGGRHPVDLGDVIRNRYKTIHLLGGGTFSQVWLAEDLQADGSGHGRLVSLKIGIAEVVNYEGDPDRIPAELFTHTGGEAGIFRHLQTLKKKRDYPNYYPEGGRYIIELYEEFTLEGPNGFHKCMVMEFGGPAIGSLYSGVMFGIPHGLPQKLALQLAEAVAFLQGCNVGHGDLHMSNILLSSARFRSWTPEEAIQALGKPKLIELETDNPGPPYGPREMVYAVNLGRWNRLLMLNDHENCDFSDYEIRVVDFGQSFIAQPLPIPYYMGIPPHVAAPEVLIRKCLLDKTIDAVQEEESVSDATDGSQQTGEKFETGEKGTPMNNLEPVAEGLTWDEIVADITDPNFNPTMRLLELSKSSPLLEVTLRSDLWSLAGTMYQVFNWVGPLFGSHARPPFVLYEIGLVFNVDRFKKMRAELGDTKFKKEWIERTMQQRFAGSYLANEHDNLKQAILRLMKVMPDERCSAVEVVEMLQEAWPHLKPPKKHTSLPEALGDLWEFFTFEWLFSSIRTLAERAMVVRRSVAKRVRSGLSSALGLHTGVGPAYTRREKLGQTRTRKDLHNNELFQRIRWSS